MKKILSYLLLMVLLIFPIYVEALDSNYQNVLGPIIQDYTNDDKITIYFFHGDGCPHCAEEHDKLNELLITYGNYIEINDYEVWHNSFNNSLMLKAKDKFSVTQAGVPFTVIGDKSFIGYNGTVGREIEEAIQYYLGQEINNSELNFGKLVEKARLTLQDYISYGGKENDEVYRELKSSKEAYEQAVMKTDYLNTEELTADEVKAETLKKLEVDLNKKIDQVSNRIIDLPLIGKKVISGFLIPIVAIILGLVDGFNPCAMWILLFIINMLFNMKDKKRMWILGITFLFTSALVYFLAMLGLKSVLSFLAVGIIQKFIALVALVGGILNLNSFRKDLAKKDGGCNVVDAKKRKKLLTKVRRFTSEKSFPLAIVGVITLALSVNVVELACSAGFPTIFISILEFNSVPFATSILYMLLYIIFYLLDDLVIFVIAMVTLEVTGISTKYNKYSHLIGGILMIVMGLLLIFKPEWLMFNF